MRRLLDSDMPIYALAFDPTGRRLAAGSVDRLVRVWDWPGESDPLICEGHTQAVTALAFAPDGKSLASGGIDWNVRLWEVDTGTERGHFEGSRSLVTALAFSADGQTLFASGGSRVSIQGDGSVCWWETTSGQLQGGLYSRSMSDWGGTTLFASAVPNDWSEAVYGAIQAFACLPDENTLVLGTAQSGVVLWNRGTSLATAMLSQQHCRAVAVSPNGHWIAAAESRSIVLWDVESRLRLATLLGHQDHVNSVAFSPDGTKLLTGSKDGTARLWEVTAGAPIDLWGEVHSVSVREIAVFDWQVGRVHAVAYAPDGLRAALAGEDGAVVVWDVE